MNQVFMGQVDEITGMASEGSFEKTMVIVARMGRDELTRQIRNFHGRFRLDFTEEYLNTASVDHLRHILLAATVNGRN